MNIECGSIALSWWTRKWVVIEREWLNNDMISENEGIGTWYWFMQHIHVEREKEILAYLTASPYPGLTGGAWLITSTTSCQQLLIISIVCVTARIVADTFHAERHASAFMMFIILFKNLAYLPDHLHNHMLCCSSAYRSIMHLTDELTYCLADL